MSRREIVGTERELNNILRLYDIGVKAVVAVLSGGLIYRAINAALSGSDPLGGWASVCLLVVTTIIVFLWIWSPRRNLDLIKEWFAHHSNYRNPQFEWISGLGTVVLFSMLLWFTSSPLIYSIIYVVYCFVYYLGIRRFNMYIRDSLQQRRSLIEGENKVENEINETLNKIHLHALDVLELYFLQRPHLRRIALMAVFGAVSLITAITGNLLGFGLANIVSSLVLVLTLIVAEIYIIIWRSKRDGEIIVLQRERDTILDDLKSQPNK